MNWLKPHHLESIKETKYVTGTVPKLDFAIMDFKNSNDTSWMSCAYAQVVYLEEPNCNKIIALTFTNDKGEGTYTFKELLLNLPMITPVSLNYLCTFYYRIGLGGEEFFQPFEGNVNWLNYINKETYGRIVFDYQAANLYSLLSGNNEMEASIWVNNMIALNDNAIEEGRNYKLDQDNNLSNVWDEYTLNGLVLAPNKKGSAILWSHLQQNSF